MICKKIELYGLIPVVSFDKMEDVLPTAKALIEGDLPIIEITLRTDLGIDAIKTISREYPELLLGAGTVLSVAQAKEAVDSGAKFIVTPGFDHDVVEWCKNNEVFIIPGCVTPTEINCALKQGLNVVKYFPANVYGGIAGCESLSGPYKGIKFIPTGGINLTNLSEYSNKGFIHSIGGSWLCSNTDITNKDYSNITRSVKASIKRLLGFELAHVGMNTSGSDEASKVSKQLNAIFDFDIREEKDSSFIGGMFEVIKGAGIGDNGHIAIKTNCIDRAIHYLNNRGYEIDESTLKKDNGKTVLVYLKQQVNGFGIHLVQN